MNFKKVKQKIVVLITTLLSFLLFIEPSMATACDGREVYYEYIKESEILKLGDYYSAIDSVKEAIASNLKEKDEDMKVKIGFAKCDLNGDGKNEILVTFDARSTALCGKTGNCSKEIYFLNKSNKLIKILDINNVNPLFVMVKKINNYNVLEMGIPGFEIPIYHFDGKKYNFKHYLDSYTKDDCISLKTNDQSYTDSINILVKLEEVSKWSTLLKKNNSKMALLENLSKTEFINQNCYWSIPVHENQSSHLVFWKELLIEVNGREVYYRNKNNNSIQLIRH